MYVAWIKIKSFIGFLIHCIILLALSFILDRFFQVLFFLIFFELIQGNFKKRFHSDSFIDNPVKAIKYCKLITIVVELLYLMYCKDLDISIYNNLFVIIVISILNALLQFYLERTLVSKSILSDKEKLLSLCLENNLTSNATKRMVMKYVENKTYKEIADIEYVDEETIKKSINRSRKKLNI